jgi:dTDP-4-amino-4,6-dideoxygalactose transaminase
MSVAVMNSTQLAIHGGSPVIKQGVMKDWPPIDDIDRRMVLESLCGKNHAFGPNCEAFQKEFAEWNGNRFAITTNSGTAALHMCIAACDCGAGDEIIVPAYTWSSSATCTMQHNCIPVFVDIDYDTMNLDIDKLEQAITPRTKAMIAVHLHGLPLEMERLCGIARAHGIKVIEDACQAHGAAYMGRRTGLWGDCAAFSLNQNKCLCGGEGGMFVTDNEELLRKAQMLWSFGETRTPSQSRDYHVYAMGWMYRNNDLAAAFGRAQLTKLDGYLRTMRENAECFDENLRGIPGLILPTIPRFCEPNWYNYILRFDMEYLGHAHDASAYRDRIDAALRAEGVGGTVWQRFILPAMTVFQARNAYGKGCPWECPHARPVDYSLDQYQNAQKQADRHTCVVWPLRPPNGPDLARLAATAVRKVMDNLDQLPEA